MALLELKAVTAGYGGNTILQGICGLLGAGEIVTLVGANGAGKSTLVKSISGLVKLTGGDLLLEGASIAGLSPAARLRKGIAHVPEGRQIFAGMTVAENLALGAYTSSDSHEIEGAWFEEICELFPILRERMTSVAGNFSGGQQQMLALARGLMSKPRILLLDEPSLGIAPIIVAEIFRLIVRLRDKGIAILLAEQNARQALSIADRAYVIENGQITTSGNAKDLLASPEIAERYFGVGVGTEVSLRKSEEMADRLRHCLAGDLTTASRPPAR